MPSIEVVDSFSLSCLLSFESKYLHSLSKLPNFASILTFSSGLQLKESEGNVNPSTYNLPLKPLKYLEVRSVWPDVRVSYCPGNSTKVARVLFSRIDNGVEVPELGLSANLITALRETLSQIGIDVKPPVPSNLVRLAQYRPI